WSWRTSSGWRRTKAFQRYIAPATTNCSRASMRKAIRPVLFGNRVFWTRTACALEAMGRIVFLLEEESMAALLRELLPKVYPEWVENIHWIPIWHNGKSDLEASIRRKLRAWREPGVRFVIMRDNDGGDCRERKAHLRSLANERSIDEVL